MRPWRRPRRLLALGSQGEEVRTLQEELARLGFDPGPADGRFGLLTRQAVRECQRRYGLLADGIAGPDLFRLLREPALRLGQKHALLGVINPENPVPWDRWEDAYPHVSAAVWPSPLPGWNPERLWEGAKAWTQTLAAAGVGDTGSPPWVWRIVCHPSSRGPGDEAAKALPGGENPPAPPGLPSGLSRRARRELVAAISRIVDRFRPLAVDLDLEPVLPGDGRRWIRLLSLLRQSLGRKGVLLMATRDLSRRPPIWPSWADDLPDAVLARHVHLMVFARRPVPGMGPPAGLGAAGLDPLLARVSAAQAYKVMVEVPLGAARWIKGPDRPLDGPEPVSYREARVEAMKHARRLRWDDEAGALTFRLRRGSQEEQYWLPAARSVERILRRVVRSRLAGVVLTPLGEEDPRVARAIPGPLTPWQPDARDHGDIPPAAGA